MGNSGGKDLFTPDELSEHLGNVHPLVDWTALQHVIKQRLENASVDPSTRVSQVEQALLENGNNVVGAVQWINSQKSFEKVPLPSIESNPEKELIAKNSIQWILEKKNVEEALQFPSWNPSKDMIDNVTNLHSLFSSGFFESITNTVSVPSLADPILTRVIVFVKLLPNESVFYSFPFKAKEMKCQVDVRGEQVINIRYLGERSIPITTPITYCMNVHPPQRRQAVMTFTAHSGEEWNLFYAHPPECLQQSDFKVTCSVPSEEHKIHPNVNIHRAIISLPPKERLLQQRNMAVASVTYEWTFKPRFLDIKREGVNYPPVAPLSPQERQHWLQKDEKYTYDQPDFKQWLDEGGLWLKEGESVIEFGYKVHMWMNKTIEYTAELKYRGCGNGGCAFGAKSRKTDCGGKSLLFCAAMRANNIPARVLQGQFAHVDPSFYNEMLDDVTVEEAKMGYHTMSEFYVDGVGWVPVESTDRQGYVFGRDRSKVFLVKHYDFIYDITFTHEGKQRTEKPYFLSGFYPVPLHNNSSYSGKRQGWFPQDELKEQVDQEEKRRKFDCG